MAIPEAGAALQFVLGSTTIILSGGDTNIAGCTYIPRTPSLPEDFDYSDYEALYGLTVTESVSVVLVGTSAEILAQVRAIEALFPVGRRLRNRPGEYLYLYYQPEGGIVQYRSQVLAGRVEFAEDALTPRLKSGAVEILIIWTRKAIWEGDEEGISLYSISTGTSSSAGSIVLNYGGMGLYIAAADVAGVIPAPVRLRFENNNGSTIGFRRFWLSLNVFGNPEKQRDSAYHVIEAESTLGGGSSTYDSLSRGSYFRTVTWTGATGHNTPLFNWTLAADKLAAFAGDRFRVLARFPALLASSLYVKLQIKIPSGATPLTTLWESQEMKLSTLYKLQDLGTIPLPPQALAGHDAVALTLSVRAAASGSLSLDFLAFLATDSLHTFEQIGYQIPDTQAIIVDGIDEQAIYYQGTGKWGIYQDNPPHIHLWPGRSQALEILWDESGGGMVCMRGLLVRAYYRPRRLTV